MLEEIRCMFMTLFTERKKKKHKELDTAYEAGSKMNVMAFGDLHFQVKDKGYYPTRRFIVDLMSRSYDCGYWELAGIPLMFKPIPNKVTWDPCDKLKLSPPEITKKIGRPKKSRKMVATEPIKKKIILYMLFLLWWDEPQCQEMRIKVVDSKRIKSPESEEDEVLVIEEEEGIEVEGAKGVIEQEEEVME
ncbi:hypothetical protein WN944_023039 [Citrus x changshan-huyou]|uniref:Uncharacterized protein n=1 Tax=Citrus x changshan-huyou TaxID=2935761 RepID=A0AAP0MZK1_9ROSI